MPKADSAHTATASGGRRKPKPWPQAVAPNDSPATGRAALSDDAQEDDWSMETIAAKAAALPDDATVALANLYHVARISMNYVSASVDQAEMEARAMWPDQPAELRLPGEIGPASWQSPTADWAAWRRELHERWVRQCQLINKGLGADLHQRAYDDALEIMDSLADRATAAPTKTLGDLKAKLGVLAWRLRLEGDMEGEDASPKLFGLIDDLNRLGASH